MSLKDYVPISFTGTLWMPLLAIVLGTTYLIFKSKKSKKETTNYPLPPNGPSFAEFFPNMMKAPNQSHAISTYGTIFTIPSPLPGIVPNQVVICEPALVKELCVKQSNMYRPPSNFTTRSDPFAYATRQVVGIGVTGLKGEEWLWRKNALLKEFHKNKLMDAERGLVDIVHREGLRILQELEKAADSNEVIYADQLTTQAAVGVVLFFLFGRTLEFDVAIMRKAAKDMIDSLFVRLTNPLYEVLKYIPMTNAYKTEVKMIAAQKAIDAVVETELDLLLEEYNGTKPVHPDRKEGSVMASLIANEPKFRVGGKGSMLAEARVFVQAGFETTAHSLAFAMGMMAERPDLADQMGKQGMEALTEDIFQNAQSSFPADSKTIQVLKQALEKTILVKNFFMEALRLYPLAPALGGECTSNIDIVTKDGIQYTLPKGTATLFLNIPLQRRQEISNPNDISPDRWDAPITQQPFLHTFQNGPHKCPGKPLSLLEGHIFLLLIASKFRFEFPEDGVTKVQFEDNGLLRPKDSMPLVVKKRHE